MAESPTPQRPAAGPGTVPARPDPSFAVVSGDAVRRSAAPTLSFAIEVSDPSGLEIELLALSVLVTIEPGSRGYDGESRERLIELFGEPERWGSTAEPLRWAQVETVIGPFRGGTTHTFCVPCTYDHEIATTKYFSGVRDGAYPLRFHFNGTTHYADADGRRQILPLAWDRACSYELPAAVWHGMIDSHYPRGGWLRVSRETLSRLGRHRARVGSPTADACIGQLLDRAERGEPAPRDGEGGA